MYMDDMWLSVAVSQIHTLLFHDSVLVSGISEQMTGSQGTLMTMNDFIAL